MQKESRQKLCFFFFFSHYLGEEQFMKVLINIEPKIKYQQDPTIEHAPKRG